MHIPRRALVLIAPLAALTIGLVTPTASLAQTPAANVTVEPTSGVVPGCDPTLKPSAPPKIITNPDGTTTEIPPCNVEQFTKLFQNIINYFTYIAFPLAALMIGWGGFQVMTAAGNTEKMSKGYSAIKIAITGIVFVLLSYFIVQAIFKLLSVDTNFSPGGI